MGNAYTKKGDYGNAIISFVKVIELRPNNDNAYNNLGIVYDKIGDYEKAIDTYEKAIALNPYDAIAYNNLGIAYAKNGDIEKAIISYGRSIALNSNNEFAYNNLGVVYDKMGDYEKAIDTYEKAISLNPYDAKPFYNLGFVYFRKGDIPKSLIHIQKALNLQPNDQEFVGFGLSIIVNHQQWPYLNQFHDQWKGDRPFSTILGESLYRVIKQNPDNKFFHFKNTFDAIRNFSFININEVINGLCIGLYKDGDMDFLRQVVDELSHDFAHDAFVKINLEVYKYLLNPEGMDINQLHPDVRTVVNSIIKEE